jgi:ABC-type ATPase involved in cell division
MAATERHLRRRRHRDDPHRPTSAPHPPATGAVVSFGGVEKRYSATDVALDRVSFDIFPGEFVFLVGHSGSGKSYALQVTGGGRREIRDKVPDILRLTGLSTKLHNYPDQLSGGEQQRVAIARAFVNHPPLLIADEPTGNLDPETSIGIMQLLYRINQTGTTVLVATHDVAMVDKMRRRVIELQDGKIVRDEQAGAYASSENTREFAIRMRGAFG